MGKIPRPAFDVEALGLTPVERAWLEDLNARRDEHYVELVRRAMKAEADLEARKQAQLEAEKRAEERRARRRRLLLFWIPGRLRTSN